MQSYQAFWGLLVCLQLSSLPQHLPLTPPTPGPKWVDQGQCAIVRCHSRRCGRAMQEPKSLLPAHCTKASLLKRINSPQPHTVHIWVLEVSLRHSVCPNMWSLMQRQRRDGRSLVEAQEPLCHSLFAAFLDHWKAQMETRESWWDALKYFQGLLEIAAALLATKKISKL